MLLYPIDVCLYIYIHTCSTAYHRTVCSVKKYGLIAMLPLDFLQDKVKSLPANFSLPSHGFSFFVCEQ